MIRIKENDRDSIVSDLIPDLTPLLDVMFMLIFFLILTTNVVNLAVDIDIPNDKAKIADDITTDNIIKIRIDGSDNNLWLNDKKINHKDFYIEFKKIYNKQKIYFIAAKDSNLQSFVDVMGFLKKEKIDKIDIVVK